MEELLKSSTIKGILLSAYDKFGPQPIYTFPACVDDEEAEQARAELCEELKLTYRDFIQISIKNMGLLIGDKVLSSEVHDKYEEQYGIIPYPDFKLTSLSYIYYLNVNFSERPIPSVLSILVDENKRSFLYNNINRLIPLIQNFFKEFNEKVKDGYPNKELIESFFEDFLRKLIKFEKEPYTPVGSKRKMKILFAGLDESGKTSFLLAVNKKYSKLMSVIPTRGVNIKSIEALGATIFLWDLGGQIGSREKYLNKSQIYLYEADLLFYFIDIRNKERFEESFTYFKQIYNKLQSFEQYTPIIFIFSKADPDLIDSEELKENVTYVKNRLMEILNDRNLEIYLTSIFSIFSVLRAFSSGISKLSPNRDLINRNLKYYFASAGSYLTLLLSIDGLVLADHYTQEAVELTNFEEFSDEEIKDVNIKNIFEVTAPQFLLLYKIFSKFKKLKEEEAVFKVSNTIILLKRSKVSDYELFFLFLLKDENEKEKIRKNIPIFLENTSDLLLRYIS